MRVNTGPIARKKALPGTEQDHQNANRSADKQLHFIVSCRSLCTALKMNRKEYSPSFPNCQLPGPQNSPFFRICNEKVKNGRRASAWGGGNGEASAASRSAPKGFALWTPRRDHAWRGKPTCFRVKRGGRRGLRGLALRAKGLRPLDSAPRSRLMGKTGRFPREADMSPGELSGKKKIGGPAEKMNKFIFQPAHRFWRCVLRIARAAKPPCPRAADGYQTPCRPPHGRQPKKPFLVLFRAPKENAPVLRPPS